MSELLTFVRSTADVYPVRIRDIIKGADLSVVGNVELLHGKAIGICGSRNASPEALAYARRFGEEAAQRGLIVVSGYARGIDREAHKGAMSAGGGTIAVLPEGMERFRVLSELHSLVDLDQNFLAISMFEPDAPWKTWRAMERNKLIVALSLGLFVVEARETGGTINAALECVRQGKPLWAVAYAKDSPAREGNKKLLQDAAIPLTRQSDVKKALDQAVAKAGPETKQLALSLN